MEKLPLIIRRALIDTARTAATSPLNDPKTKIPLRSLAALSIQIGNSNHAVTTVSTPFSPSSSTPLPTSSSSSVSSIFPSSPRLYELISSLVQNSSSSSTPTSPSFEKDSTETNGSKTATNTKKRTLHPLVAETLLNEIRSRLAMQHHTCLDIIDAVSSLSTVQNPSISSSSIGNKQPLPIPSIKTTPATTTTNESRQQMVVVRAINQPVVGLSSSKKKKTGLEGGGRTWSETVVKAAVEREKNDGLRELRNLEVLHADTFALTHHLLSNGKPTLKRFSNADRTLLASTFEQIRSRHATTVETMADVVLRLREVDRLLYEAALTTTTDTPSPHPTTPTKTPTTTTSITSTSVTPLVETFLRSRLPIQFLCDHYVALHRYDTKPHSGTKPHGAITLRCPVLEVVEDAILEARHVCDDNGGNTPEVTVELVSTKKMGGGGKKKKKKKGRGGKREVERKEEGEGEEEKDMLVDLVRPYVHHTLVELLKNGMVSSIEKWRNEGGGCAAGSMPTDVCVRIAVDEETDGYLTIDVVDRGVGLPPTPSSSNNNDDDEADPFRFTYSSSPQRWDRIDEQQSYAAVRSPLGSLGVGLTSSRMMVQMFGGDVLLWDNSRNREKSEQRKEEDAVGCTARLVWKKDAEWWMGEYWK